MHSHWSGSTVGSGENGVHKRAYGIRSALGLCSESSKKRQLSGIHTCFANVWVGYECEAMKEGAKESESKLNLKTEPCTTKGEKDMKLTQYLLQETQEKKSKEELSFFSFFQFKLLYDSLSQVVSWEYSVYSGAGSAWRSV